MSDNDLILYLSAVAQGRVMLEKGLITERDYRQFEEKMRFKYNLPERSIFRDDRLLYKESRGNMRH